jgi:tRNA threonylcarbamoyladenosine biosynthesis protein TsaB
MSWLLALDGATDQLALALVAPDGTAITRDQPGGPLASATLLPSLMSLLQEADIRPAQLSAIGFGQGPGAFTGLRAVCAVAQGLALGWNLPVLALDSLLLVVQDAAVQSKAEFAHWGAVMDARMGELYAARYQRHAQGWVVLESPGLWKPEALALHWQSQARPAAMAGTGVALCSGIEVPSWAQAHSRAAALAQLCHQAWAAGEAQDAAQAVPLYVRDKVALTTAEREKQRELQRELQHGAQPMAAA